MMRLLYLLDKGVSLGDFFSVVALIIPSLLFSIMPLITMLASIFVYNRLSEDRQLLILKACGLDDFSLATPALYVAAIFTILNLFISAYLMPVSYNKLKIQLGVMRNSYISSIIEIRKFNQISKDTTLYIEGMDSENNLYGIVLFDNRDPVNRSVIFAKHGLFNMDSGEAFFQLKNGLRQAYDSSDSMTRLYFDDLTVKIENEQLDVTHRNKSSLESFIGEMLNPDPSWSEDRQVRRKTDGHMRIIWPFFNLAFTFLGISFFLKIRHNRNQNWINLLSSFIPVVIAAFIHFTLQKLAYSNLNIIFLCYANTLACIIISIWNCKRKII